MVESEVLAAAVDVAAAVGVVGVAGAAGAAAVVDVADVVAAADVADAADAADVLRRGRSFCSRRSIATKARNAGQTRVS